MQKKSLEKLLKQTSQIINSRISKIFSTSRKSDILDAMKYSSISQGKKIRPFLIFLSASLLGLHPRKMLDIAVAIELIHTYSLIHDDLPAMDDDDMRRHKPACHKRFTEATAILAGDALLTYAFEILSGNEHFCAQVKCQMINGVAKAIGCFGMAGGQDLDLRYKNSQISLDKILEIQSLKTGKLFEICIDLAIIASGNSGKSCQILQQYAKNFGIIFQIKDDIEDYEKNLQNLSEVNIVKILGLSSSKIKLEELRNDASLILSQNFPRNLFSELLWI